MKCVSLALIAFVFLWDPTPSWLLFNKLKNKACHYSLIVAQFRGRYIQVKDNEIVDSGSLRVTASVIYRWPLYAGQLNSKYKGWFWGSCSVTQIMYQSNPSCNIPPTSPGNTPGIWIFGKFLFKFPPHQAEKLFKCPQPWENYQITVLTFQWLLLCFWSCACKHGLLDNTHLHTININRS